MKKILFLLMMPILCFGQYTAIPDGNFEKALIDLGYDNVIDGQVLSSNFDTITRLSVSNKNISDLTGIEAFSGLTELFCAKNNLTHLNVSNNTALTLLGCFGNQLTNLDLSNNRALTSLTAGSNQISNLDLSNNTALTLLGCSKNKLTNLDLSNNTALTDLSCFENKFDCDALKAKYNIK